MNYMPKSFFYDEPVPNELIPKMIITGGYTSVYTEEAPLVPIVGDWKKRYCTLAESFTPILDRVHNFEVRESDVWILTSTKCGTTWAQEMTWLILNDFDFEKAKEVDLTLRSPFLEFNGVVPNVEHDTMKHAEEMDSPRLIKSHLPIPLLPKQLWTKKPKIIYVFRNPKDAAISYFHHWRGMVGYKGTKEEFMHAYMDGYVNFNPFWPHVLDFWHLREKQNIYFTSYERMKFDLRAVVSDVCQFLNKKISFDEMEKLVDHLSFDKMKVNPACNHEKEFQSIKQAAGVEVEEFRFVRRGVVGSHKDELPHEVIEEFDEWTDDNLKDFNLTVDEIISYHKY
ncbi:amine sulfotransferase isoform X2 [Eupeodes corollae]|uniref:amine sulfotransferase isoform X2 n=1 Tax=Eupeodes corollae TaxID=290404 RepID=UPI00249225DC|nr:amine sulfotransferase isoform X2 [Eupeodes corollae]